MRFIVTGAGGLIGSEVAALLSAAGHDVCRLTHHQEPDAICVDLANQRQLDNVDWACDGVIHTAASLPTAFDGADAIRAAELNRQIDLNVFSQCASRRLSAVYISGTSVYGPRFSDSIVDEESDVAPMGPYVCAKLESEVAGRELFSRRRTPFAVLRVTSPYGPRQRTQTVLQIFLRRLIEKQPLMYFGDGTREQDFTFVSDVASAVEAAATRRANAIFNISGGRPITMRSLAELIARLFPDWEARVQPAGRDDPQEGIKARFSCKKAALELDWKPVTPLEQGLQACFEAITRSRC